MPTPASAKPPAHRRLRKSAVNHAPASGTALAPPATLPLNLGPGASAVLPWTADSIGWVPSGLEVLTEVRVAADGLAPSVRRTLLSQVPSTR